jgi:hypothetical protein
MATYALRLTWIEPGTRNAAMRGCDEDCLLVTADSLEEAMREAEEGARYHWGDEVADCEAAIEVSTWCVCGQEVEGPWETVQDGLATREEAEDWLRQNHRDHLEYVAFYVDPEHSASGTAECYFDRHTDGSLVCSTGERVELFAE